MKEKILAVKEFHKAFKLDYLDDPKADLGEDKNTSFFNNCYNWFVLVY